MIVYSRLTSAIFLKYPLFDSQSEREFNFSYAIQCKTDISSVYAIGIFALSSVAENIRN